jgi:hypothetical protein
VGDNKPPIGGADLECLLSCKELPVVSLRPLEILKDHGFTLLEKEPLIMYVDDLDVTRRVASAGEVEEFIEYMESHRVRHCIANFIGRLVDIDTTMHLNLDFKNSVVAVMVSEDVLWGFTEDASKADYKNLEKFAECCKSVAEELNPIYAYIGTETMHTEDMKLDTAEKEGGIKYDESFFSEKNMKELFDWYINYYVKRWEHKK